MTRRCPPHHNADGPGFERPAVMPPCPAEVAARVYERALLGAGVGWFNLAKMTGRTVHDLRRDHDRGYRAC